jgi:hypothetical protein
MHAAYAAADMCLQADAMTVQVRRIRERNTRDEQGRSAVQPARSAPVRRSPGEPTVRHEDPSNPGIRAARRRGNPQGK